MHIIPVHLKFRYRIAAVVVGNLCCSQGRSQDLKLTGAGQPTKYNWGCHYMCDRLSIDHLFQITGECTCIISSLGVPGPSKASEYLRPWLFPAVLAAGWFGLGGLQVAYADDDEKEVDFFTIRGTNEVVKAGDSVLVKLPDVGNPQYMARIEKIVADNQNNAKVRVRRYYRPVEAIGGRRQFHGSKELFLSDQYAAPSANTISQKYLVHSLRNYMKLENVGAEDYFCRFEYNAATGAFKPDRVAVYCKCEMPRNPDEFMLKCRKCFDWFHPACENMSTEAAKQLDYFMCSACTN